MLAIILTVVSCAILIAEFWLGIAVIGWQGERLFLERAKTPGPYWMMMVLHTTICVALPLLAFVAGI